MRYSVLFLSSCVMALQPAGCGFGEYMATWNFLCGALVLLEPEHGELVSLVTTTTNSCATICELLQRTAGH